ncbi:oxidoreductase/nitrogenase component 1 [Syntrophobotulus glycolicus DSM 8271]|uniref:Oxidoreductase/nitrogenase component 1 n=1 Tax=Syntrophobotulus glycolicus (strain DSM 8271 / FlGlyR) TaxID=645991 RepID=F0SYJ3_SYNGF|nr:nitrogenase component 1 [Syntrophobotulus glycolicus]ADY57105.1 oxidoreductase/nitrogenase component 1 [Syntrophobotulus glycolicus DSM 8271]
MKKQIDHYRNVNENPCHMCMPIGGILAMKGIEGSMTLLHGSQGCATYMRRLISEHYNEPLDVASTSLNEKGTVYGGEANLKKGLENVRKVYDPKIIGVLTTCLAETIGEDIERIKTAYLAEKNIPEFPIVAVSTPGYGGTQTEGYFVTLKRVVMLLAKETARHNKINLIVPHISTADLRELKRILQMMAIEYTLLPDHTETLDAPYLEVYQKIMPGGTKLEDIEAMSGARATIEFGLTVDEAHSPGKFLAQKYGVPLYKLPLPVGVRATDEFLETLRQITGRPIPEEISKERGRLLDAMIDAHKHNFQGRAAIFGEPEFVHAAANLCLENGVTPKVIATGSKTRKLTQLLEVKLGQLDEECVILEDNDFAHILTESQRLKVNIAIGHSEGKILKEKSNIPLVRWGFPITDRVGGQRIRSVGYSGSLAFLDRITNTLLENKYEHYRTNIYNNYFRQAN